MSEMEVPKGWELTKLGDVGEYKYGYNGKATSDNSGKPYLRITDINFDGSLKPNRVFVNISDDDFERYELKNNDIVIARTGATVGKSFLFNCGNNFVFASYLIRYRFDTEKIIPKFLYFVLQSPSFWKYIGISQSVSAQPNVNATKMSKFNFYLPPLQIQKKIIQKLDDVLAKLEEKKKQIFLLLEQNKGRIDFFVKNWYSFSISNLIENHPQRKKWEILQLEQIADVIDPHPSHRAPPKVTDGFPFAGIGDIAEDGTINVEKARKIDEKFVIQQEVSYEINDRSIGYGRVASVGKVMRLRKQKFRYAISPTLAVINPNEKINHNFLFYILSSNYFFQQVSEKTTGSTRTALGIMKLRKILVLIPPIIQQEEIVKKIKNLNEQFKSQKTQFENIKENYESKIKYMNHIQSSILNSAFTGKLVN